MDQALFFTRRSLALTCVFTMLIGFMVFGATPALADTFSVNSSADAADTAPGDGECEGNFFQQDLPTPSATQRCTLRAAVQEANRSEEPDTINVDVRRVTLTIPEDGGDESGDLDLTDSQPTTILGNDVEVRQTTNDRVFEVHEGAVATLSEMDLVDGFQEVGAGLLNSGHVTLDEVEAHGGFSAAGGGVYNEGELTATGMVLEGNVALFAGGGLYNEGPNGSASVVGGNIGSDEDGQGNVAGDVGGGVMNTGWLEMTSTAIVSNTAATGGGAANVGGFDSEFALFRASGVSVERNVAQANEFNGPRAEQFEGSRFDETGIESHEDIGRGGGIFNNSALFMELSEINDNVAEESPDEEEGSGGEGGGLFNTGAFSDGSVNQPADFEDSELCFLTEFVISEFGSGACLTETTLDGNVAEGLPFANTDAVSDNAQAGKGGGIWNGTRGDFEAFLALDRSDLEDNDAAFGGGLYHQDAYLFSTETAFVDNGSSQGSTDTAGGGAFLTGWSEESEEFEFGACNTSTCIQANTFSDNQAFDGGGLYAVRVSGDSSRHDVVHSTFNDNGAQDDGAGIWNNTDLHLMNSTLSSNNAGDEGGGLYNDCENGWCGDVSSLANTFNGNVAGPEGEPGDTGGNVHDQTNDTVHFRMTIVANGFPTNCNDPSGESSYDDDGYNLEDTQTYTATGRSSCGFTTETGSILGEDPELGPLANYGGPTETHALMSGSPALDAVDEGQCPPPEDDQRYLDRPEEGDGETETGSGCDIGSFEHQQGERFPSTGGGGGGGSGAGDDDDFTNPGDPANVRVLDVSPETARNGLPADNTHQLSTQLDGDGDVSQVSIDFKIVSGPNAKGGSSASDFSCVTNDDGACTAQYTSNGEPGTDLICGWVDAGGDQEYTEDGRSEHDGGECVSEPRDEAENTDQTDVVEKVWFEGQDPGPDPDPDPGEDEVPAACTDAAQGSNVIVGTDGDDELTGTDGRDVICALAGDDTVSGLGGGDLILGGAGNDVVRGGRGADTVLGGSGNDTIRGGRGADVLRGGVGDDAIFGNIGNDELRGGPGRDRLRGGKGNDFLSGGPDTDSCRGDAGSDSQVGCESS